MIFVTVGNANQPFDRLLRGVERCVEAGSIADEVLIQAGNTRGFNSSRCKVVDFLPAAEFERVLKEARVIISHAGAGTLIHVLRAGKTPVLMPRREKYGEHVDDHQVEIVEALAAEGRVIAAYEPEDLPAAVAAAEQRGRQAAPSAPTQMIEMVARAIEELSVQRKTMNRTFTADGAKRVIG
ncbi:MAG TPA: glycosyltransferase [Candidatus Binataceae bacterium]|nr:glycosyltransferase [Candidatus Binataceae bacterium]